MDFFDQIGNKISEESQSVVQKTKDAAETLKINILITDEEKKIEALYNQDGKAYYEKCSGNYDPEFEQFARKIGEALQVIEDHKFQLELLKEGKRCPKCDALVNKNSAFCTACGAKIEEDEQPVCPQKAVCSSCGKELSAGAAFCTACGAKVEQNSAESFAATPIVAEPADDVTPVQINEDMTPVVPIVQEDECDAVIPAVAEVQEVAAEAVVPEIPQEETYIPETAVAEETVAEVEAPVGAEEVKTITCPSCGKELSEGTLFCTNCGKKLEDEEMIFANPENELFANNEVSGVAPVVPFEQENAVSEAEDETFAPVESGKVCSCCGAGIDVGNLFCINCGKVLDASEKVDSENFAQPAFIVCSNCGKSDIPEGTNFCTACGTPL